MKKYIGKHIIADLYECNFNTLNKISLNDLKNTVSLAISDCKLTEVGNHYSKFPNKSISAVISLAESHLTFHTWPEINYISLDIFVCNYKKDNSKKAECLYKKMLKLFKPKTIKLKNLSR